MHAQPAHQVKSQAPPHTLPDPDPPPTFRSRSRSACTLRTPAPRQVLKCVRLSRSRSFAHAWLATLRSRSTHTHTRIQIQDLRTHMACHVEIEIHVHTRIQIQVLRTHMACHVQILMLAAHTLARCRSASSCFLHPPLATADRHAWGASDAVPAHATAAATAATGHGDAGNSH